MEKKVKITKLKTAKPKGHRDIPWEEMEREFFATEQSLRAIALRYEIAPSYVYTHASKHNWAERKERYRADIQSKTLDRLAKEKIANNVIAIDILTELLKKAKSCLDILKDGDTKGLKDITATMRDLKELGAFKLDDTDETTIKVIFEGGEDYGN